MARRVEKPPARWRRTWLHAPVWAWALIITLVIAVAVGLAIAPPVTEQIGDLPNLPGGK
ncbi:membrane protein [Gordonia phage Oregano]|nr:membrane protein [Gordonia phage Oregano]